MSGSDKMHPIADWWGRIHNFDFCSETEPANPLPYMTWINPTTQEIKVRNRANTAWIPISGGGPGADEKVKVSPNDLAAGYLGAKLAAGTCIQLTELDDGGDENLQIAMSPHDHDSAAEGGDDLNPKTISSQTFLIGPSCPHTTLGAAVSAVNAAGPPSAANPYVIKGMGIVTAETGNVTIPAYCTVVGMDESFVIGMGANVLSPSSNSELKDMVVVTTMDASTVRCIDCNNATGFKLSNVRVRFTPHTAGENVAFHFRGSSSGSAYHCVAEPLASGNLAKGFVIENTANVVLWNCEADDTNLDDGLWIQDTATVTSRYCTFFAKTLGGNDVHAEASTTWYHTKCNYRSDHSVILGTETPLLDGKVQIKYQGLFLDTGGQIGMVNVVNEFSTDGTLAGNSDLAVPTEKAVKTYADGLAVADEKVKVSADDTAADYLIQKLAAGTGISITEVNPGGNEDARIACTLNGVPSGLIGLWNNSDTCPTGYTRVSGADNRLLMAVAAGAGGVAGTGSHSHTLADAFDYGATRVYKHVVGRMVSSGGGDLVAHDTGGAEGGWLLSRSTNLVAHLYYCYKVLV